MAAADFWSVSYSLAPCRIPERRSRAAQQGTARSTARISRHLARVLINATFPGKYNARYQPLCGHLDFPENGTMMRSKCGVKRLIVPWGHQKTT